MKKFLSITLTVFLMVSCKDKPSETKIEAEPNAEETVISELPTYPDNLVKVFDAHGGLDTWNEMETLEFSVAKGDGYEITTTDLKERFALIEMPDHSIGYDGESIWVTNKGKSKYDGDPKTYYNKMFYLYAMPFIVSDEGATFKDVAPLHFENKEFPGIKVTNDNRIDDRAPKSYVVYYDPQTYKMTWLGYHEISNDNKDDAQMQYIKYNSWQEVEGLLLPEDMAWYASDGKNPTEIVKEIKVISPMLTTVKMDSRVYSMPENAEMIP